MTDTISTLQSLADDMLRNYDFYGFAAGAEAVVTVFAYGEDICVFFDLPADEGGQSFGGGIVLSSRITAKAIEAGYPFIYHSPEIDKYLVAPEYADFFDRANPEQVMLRFSATEDSGKGYYNR